MRTLCTLFFFAVTLLLSAQENAVFENILKDYFEPDGPGATAIVVKEGEIVFEKALGKASVELDVDLTPGHVFRLGSITKQFTAIAIMMLMEEGKLSVEDPITKFLPDYPFHDHHITVEHLLTHTSGIQSYTGIPGFMQNETRTDLTVEELIDVFKDEEMNFDPGTEWSYNNSGYILLGAIIEEVSGQSYADFIRDRIFQPLEMTSSYYGSNSAIIPQRASGYEPRDGGIINARYLSMTLPYAAGSLLSTVGDLAKWNTAVMHEKLVSAATLEKVFTPYTTSDGENTNYGYGWHIDELLGSKVYQHGGGIFGFLTTGLYAPDEDIYVAVLSNCNCNSPEDAGTRIMAHAIGKSLEVEEIEMTEAELSEYVGVYAIEDADENRVIRLEDGHLVSQRGDNQQFGIYPYAKDKFAYENLLTRMEVTRGADGKISGHYMLTPQGDKSFAMLTDDKVEAPEVVVVPIEVLDKYIGKYELMPDFILTVSRQDDRLMAQATGQAAFMLTPRDQTTFVVPQVGARIEFQVQDSGDCDELILYQGGQTMPAPRMSDER